MPATTHATQVFGWVWDVNLLEWVKMQQPILNAGSVVVSGTVSQGTGGTSPWLASSKIALTASTPTTVSVGVASAQAVASNVNRKGLTLVNLSANTISFGLGQAAILNNGISLTQNGVWEMDEFTFTTAAINAIASVAASTLAVQEFA